MQLTVTEALGGLPQHPCLAGRQRPAGYADPCQRPVVRPVQPQCAGAGVTAAPGTRVARRPGRKGGGHGGEHTDRDRGPPLRSL